MGSLKNERRSLTTDHHTSPLIVVSDSPDAPGAPTDGEEGHGGRDIISPASKRLHNSPTHRPHGPGSPHQRRLSTDGGEDKENVKRVRRRSAPSETTSPDCSAPFETTGPDCSAPSETTGPDSSALSETTSPDCSAPSETTNPDCGHSIALDCVSVPAEKQPWAGSASEDKHLCLLGSTEMEDIDTPHPALQQHTMSNPSHTDAGKWAEGQQHSKEREEEEEKEKEGTQEKEVLWTSSVVEPCLPASPARQQHMQTQVSLEVVQCHSAATSPMTPPQGDATFYFPCSSGRLGGVGKETKDAELQVGRQVEFRSVATAPMTPKTPTNIEAFPEISRSERGETEERSEEKRREERAGGETPSSPESDPEEVQPHLELAPTLRCTTPIKGTKEIAPDSRSLASDTPGNSTQSELAGSSEAEETIEDKQYQRLPRMGTLDQDITILVTHHDEEKEEEEEEEEEEVVKKDEEEVEARKQNESQIYSGDHEMLRLHKCKMTGNVMDVLEDTIEVKGVGDKVVPTQHISADSMGVVPINDPPQKTPLSDTTTPPATPLPSFQFPPYQEPPRDEDTMEALCSSEETGAGFRSSPARQQHVQTQVSLEVVQCHSVATSPMTPPQEGAAFYFPCSSGRLGGVGTDSKDAELQVGPQVEFRSVATAPMTPTTPTTLGTFPEINRERGQMEERNVEEERMDKKERMKEKIPEDAERSKMTEEKQEERFEGTQEGKSERGSEQKSAEETGEKPREITEEELEEKLNEKAREPAEEKSERNWDEKEVQIEQKDEGTKEKSKEKVEVKEDPKAGDKSEKNEEKKLAERVEDEVVQEVRWDEKGMTWEVYGAVVEVAVLGSAIQKHLEKQVKKHRKQPSSALPPPPPLRPTATPLPSTPPPPPAGGSPGQGGPGKGRAGRRGERGRRRRNPFRLLLQNMQQPHCCSRAHTTE